MGEDERIDAEDVIARVLVQIPDPRRHLVRYRLPAMMRRRRSDATTRP